MTWWKRPSLWAAASAIAVLIANAGGLAIGDDGIGYEAISDSIRTGNGLGYFLEPRLTIWPPLWPALMALISKVTTLNPEGAAIVLNALTAAAVVLLVSRILRRLVRSEQVQLVGTAVVALGASSMVFGHLLMTDFALAAVTMALFLVLMNHRDAPSWKMLALAALLITTAFMIRYAGVVTLATAVVWLSIDRRRTVRQRITDVAGLSVAALIVPVAWVLRNHSIDGTTLGERWSSKRGLIPNTFDALATVGNFLTPGVAIGERMIFAVVAVLGTLVMAAMLARALRADTRVRSVSGAFELLASPTGLVGGHAVVYLVYMLYVRTTTGLNQLDFRLLNPMYLSMVIVALVILDRVIADRSDVRWQRAARVVLGSWAGLNLIIGLGMVAYFSTDPALFDGNYESRQYDLARASSALDALPAGCRTASNLPNAFYKGGLEPEWSPFETGLESDDPSDDIEVLVRELSEPDAQERCLVWVDLQPRWGHLATRATLRQHVNLVELASDGAVTTYRIEPLDR